MRALVVLLLLICGPARAESIVLGLSAEEVAITVTFDGSELLIFGAVDRDAPPPPEPLEVIVTVSGPLTPVKVRRAARMAGIWVNTAAVEVDAAPSFYAVATSAPLNESLLHVEDLRYSITTPRAIRSVGNTISGAGAFTQALIRIREEAGAYRMDEESVDFEQQTLFRTAVELPANLIEGNYTIRIFLTREGRVIDSLETMIGVQKVGLERWLFNLSREYPPVYGLLALALAVAAGWGASAAFAFLRR
ncbi:TIGR02186 family protein [Wenxinia marina]|uniref:Putative transmembrane protein n=1 Tax=Wenxinia marina DSM 24838 TaxID=1123501 RepID=A0A0D0NQG9_9RHOB|nr:TIGR02186 family protein [Wenxinia marina]KIQ70520.1 Putative transmembrane protein [Wenxinia marina DSM 24838]GGL52496.1 membrane protein [Wenxinia marina]